MAQSFPGSNNAAPGCRLALLVVTAHILLATEIKLVTYELLHMTTVANVSIVRTAATKIRSTVAELTQMATNHTSHKVNIGDTVRFKMAAAEHLKKAENIETELGRVLTLVPRESRQKRLFINIGDTGTFKATFYSDEAILINRGMFAVASPPQWANCAKGICRERLCQVRKPTSCTQNKPRTCLTQSEMVCCQMTPTTFEIIPKMDVSITVTCPGRSKEEHKLKAGVYFTLSIDKVCKVARRLSDLRLTMSGTNMISLENVENATNVWHDWKLVQEERLNSIAGDLDDLQEEGIIPDAIHEHTMIAESTVVLIVLIILAILAICVWKVWFPEGTDWSCFEKCYSLVLLEPKLETQKCNKCIKTQ